MSITILKKYENHIDNFIVELSSCKGGEEKYVYRVVLMDLDKSSLNQVSPYLFTDLSDAENCMDAMIFGSDNEKARKRQDRRERLRNLSRHALLVDIFLDEG